jgi:hypothetical protein
MFTSFVVVVTVRCDHCMGQALILPPPPHPVTHHPWPRAPSLFLTCLVLFLVSFPPCALLVMCFGVLSTLCW